MSKINFPGNPNNGASHRWNRRRRFNYSSSKGGWQAKGATPPTPTAPTLNASTDLQDMNDATGLAARMRGMAVMYNSYSDFPTEAYTGTFAYTRDTNELYVWTGDNPTPPTALYGDRGMFMGGGSNAEITTKTIEWMSLVTGGNANSFVDTFNVANAACSTTNGQRAVTVGLFSGSSVVKYISIPEPSTETYASGWSLTNDKAYSSATGDTVYGVFFTISSTDQTTSATDAIEYITIDTTGSSTIFGNLTEPTSRSGDTGASDGTRGIHAGGTLNDQFTETGYVNTIVYITIATPSNATDFGDLTVKRAQSAACHDDTRAVFTGGQNYIYGGNGLDTADYVTIATTGQATSFGTLDAERYDHGSTSNGTYGYTVGGYKTYAIRNNDIRQFTIQTNATSTDFADLTQSKTGMGTTSGFAS